MIAPKAKTRAPAIRFYSADFSRGFTLIELLVVLTIIALLAAIVIASFTESKKRARDARRVSDINAIVKGLALYNNTTDGRYPNTNNTKIIINGASDTLSLELKNADAMTAVPTDPLHDSTYEYFYASADGSTYTLEFCQETSSIRGLTKDCNNQITP